MLLQDSPAWMSIETLFCDYAGLGHAAVKQWGAAALLIVSLAVTAPSQASELDIAAPLLHEMCALLFGKVRGFSTSISACHAIFSTSAGAQLSSH